MIDCSVITCDEVIDAADNVSTNDCFSVPINAGNTVSINCDGKKVRYRIVLFCAGVILLSIVAIIYHHKA